VSCVGVLPFLVLASVSLDDGVAPLILQLLQCALCGSKAVEQTKSGNASTAAAGSTSSGASTNAATSSVSPAKSKKEDKTESKSSADVKKKEGNYLLMTLKCCLTVFLFDIVLAAATCKIPLFARLFDLKKSFCSGPKKLPFGRLSANPKPPIEGSGVGAVCGDDSSGGSS